MTKIDLNIWIIMNSIHQSVCYHTYFNYVMSYRKKLFKNNERYSSLITNSILYNDIYGLHMALQYGHVFHTSNILMEIHITFEIFQYLNENNSVDKKADLIRSASVYAAEHCNLEYMKYIVENGYQLHYAAIGYAIMKDAIECLKYAHSYGHAIMQKDLVFAGRINSVLCREYIEQILS